MNAKPKLSFAIALLLSLLLMAGIFLLMVLFSIAIQLFSGPGQPERMTFGNEFFIQGLVFTFVVIQALLLTGRFDFKAGDARSLLALRRTGGLQVFLAVLAAAALSFPLSELDNWLQLLWPPMAGERAMFLAAYHPESSVEKVFVILSLMAAAPVGEELIYRGAMFSWLRETGGRGAALCLTALLFGLSHIFIPRTMPLILPVGFLLGWTLLRTGSIFPSIAAHAAFNGLPLILYWSGVRIAGYNSIEETNRHLPPAIWLTALAVLIASLAALEWAVKRKARPQP